MNDRTGVPPVIGVILLVVVAASCAPRESTASPSSSTPPLALPSATLPLATETPRPESQIAFPGAPPAWLGDPAINMLAYTIPDGTPCRETGTYSLVFLNAETGEDFEVTVPPAGAIMWLDPTRFGLLSMDGQAIVSMDLTDGSIGTTSFEAEGIRLLRGTEPFPPQEFDCTMTPLNVVRDDPSGEEGLVFVPAAGPDWSIPHWQGPFTATVRSSYSANLSLFAEGSDGHVSVREVGTGAAIWTSDPGAGYGELSEFEFAWSPVDPTRLAVTQCDWQGTDRCFGQRLFLVNATTGEELASFPGDFMNIAWSPDGRRILYQRPDWQISDWFSGPPCVLELTTGENECIEEIAATHFPPDLPIPQMTITVLQWDRRGDGFYYTYVGNLYPPPPAASVANSGFCRYDIVTREIECPSTGVSELQGVMITGAHVSADGRSVFLRTGWHTEEYGVLAPADRRFFRLPSAPPAGTDFFGLVSRLWRPSPPRAAVETSRPTRQDLGEIPSIWAFYGLEDQLTFAVPGRHQFAVHLNADDVFAWPFYWCALGRESLRQNLDSIAVEFAIDGVQVPQTDIRVFNTQSGEWVCQSWATVLSGWAAGSQPSLNLTFSLSNPVSDGADTYPAGDYSFELLATVGE